CVRDFGSWYGSPAVPIRLCSNIDSMNLVEARSRRAEFLRHLCAVLQLKNVHVHRAVFEGVLSHIPRPDWVTLQAVAPTEELLQSIREIAKSTTVVVWITANDMAVQYYPHAEKRSVPLSKNCAVRLTL